MVPFIFFSNINNHVYFMWLFRTKAYDISIAAWMHGFAAGIFWVWVWPTALYLLIHRPIWLLALIGVPLLVHGFFVHFERETNGPLQECDTDTPIANGIDITIETLLLPLYVWLLLDDNTLPAVLLGASSIWLGFRFTIAYQKVSSTIIEPDSNMKNGLFIELLSSEKTHTPTDENKQHPYKKHITAHFKIEEV